MQLSKKEVQTSSTKVDNNVGKTFDNSTNQHKKRTMIAILSLSLCFLLATTFGLPPLLRNSNYNNLSIELATIIVEQNTIKDEFSLPEINLDFDNTFSVNIQQNHHANEENNHALVNINEVTQLLATESKYADKHIQTIKELSDFNGYTYYVIEFANEGYIICDNQFAVIIEAGLDGESPYANQTGNLLYLGPTHYYTMPELQPRNGNSLFRHTILNEQIETSDVANLQEASTTISNVAKEYQLVKQEWLKASLTRSGTETGRIANQTFISSSERDYNYNNGSTWDIENFGGNCTYVAAGIVANYWAKKKGKTNLLPETWFGEKGTQEQGRALIKSIQNIMPGPSIGIDAAISMTAWSSYKGYNLPAQIFVKPTPATVFSLTKADRPLVMGGYLPSPKDSDYEGKNIMHAVTVHGVRRWKNTFLGITIAYSDYVYEINYGWNSTYNNREIKASFLNLGLENAFVIGY